MKLHPNKQPSIILIFITIMTVDLSLGKQNQQGDEFNEFGQQHNLVMPNEAYDKLFNFIETEPSILDKSLKYNERSEKEQIIVMKWAIRDPTFSQYLVEQIAKNYRFGWVYQLSKSARQQLLSTLLIEYRNSDKSDPAVMGQITQQLSTNPQISSAIERQYIAVQPDYS